VIQVLDDIRVGHKRTWRLQFAMSAFHSIADIHCGNRNVCFGPIGDIAIRDSCHSLATPLARRFTGLSSNRHNVLISTRATTFASNIKFPRKVLLAPLSP
jgi:hypothetical protein